MYLSASVVQSKIMPTESSTIPKPGTELPSLGRDGGGFEPPIERGGGGGGNGDNFPNYGQQLRRARMVLAIAVAPILTVFIVLSIIYLLRKSYTSLDETSGTYVKQWVPVNLPTGLLLFNTMLLLAGSFAAEMARRRITWQAALAPVKSIPGVSLGKEPSFPWLGSTVVLGLAFLTGQWMAWRELAARGFYIATSASSSFVYVLTGTHAVHLLGGVIVLLYASTISALQKPIESQRIVVDVTAWYWHLMLLLWIYILGLMWFAR